VVSKTPPRSTIYDLSQKTGLSASTISAVLNGTWRHRRIKDSTAKMIRALAREHDYMPNRQAQGLRTSQSRLIGLVIPAHNSRHFASIAQTFEAHVRLRRQCPIVVSAGRDPEKERETARTLISYAIDALVICGAADPDGVHDICSAAGLRHVNIDLPGTKAASVVSDNVYGATILTRAIAANFPAGALRPGDLHFFGGDNDFATRDRVKGFKKVAKEVTGAPGPSTVHLTGYDAVTTQHAFETFLAENARVPPAIFINSSINYEGFLRFISSHPELSMSEIHVGCYDYDPFASFLSYSTSMIRQNVSMMMAKAFELLDAPAQPPAIHYIKPELIPPQVVLPSPSEVLIDPARP
jgi:LacI family fructose operon transcriptional repressor